MLSQQDSKGGEHLIANGGRTLFKHETKWHVTDKDGLALVEAVKQFWPYLANTKFTVYTDNISVKWLKQIQNCQGRLRRWALSLQGYNFSIVHKSRSANGTADGQSRKIHPSKERVSMDNHSEPENLGKEAVCPISNQIKGTELTAATLSYSHKQQVQTAEAFPTTTHTDGEPKTKNFNEVVNDDRYKDLIKLQRKCEFYRDIVKYKLFKEVPKGPQKARSVVAESYQFKVGPQGLLFHLYPRTNYSSKEGKMLLQLAVPKNMRHAILKSVHDSLSVEGHKGFECTYVALRLKYFWPSMRDDTRNFIQTCESCHSIEYQNKSNHFQNIQTNENPKTTSSQSKKNKVFRHSSHLENTLPESSYSKASSHKTVSLDSSLDSDVHSAKDTDKILSSKRTNGKLYYHVQWKANKKAKTWESAQSVPSVLVKEMHVKRTMSGRNKRHKLQNHKFFDKTPTVQCLKPGQYRDQIIGVRESYHPYSEPHRYTIYDNIQGNSQTRMLTTEPDQTMKIWMRSYLDTLFNMYRENVHRNESHSKIGIQDNGEQFIGKMIRESHTCDPTDFENTTYFKVFSLGSKTPMWLPIQQVPPYCLRNFLFQIRNDFRLPSEF